MFENPKKRIKRIKYIKQMGHKFFYRLFVKRISDENLKRKLLFRILCPSRKILHDLERSFSTRSLLSLIYFGDFGKSSLILYYFIVFIIVFMWIFRCFELGKLWKRIFWKWILFKSFTAYFRKGTFWLILCAKIYFFGDTKI